MKSFNEFILESTSYAGSEIKQYVINITPNDSDIPDYFIKKYIEPNNNWKLKRINLRKLLKNDTSFAEYYNSGEIRYKDHEVHDDSLDNPLVVYKNELLDGYSRASALLRLGDDLAFAYTYKTNL